MAELGVVTRALLAIARGAVDERDLARQICTACVDGLDIDGAAVSLLTASSSGETLWATGATAELLEDLQFTLNEGAGVEAATTGRPVLVPDLRSPTRTARWPMFAAAAVQEAGVGAVFALPLQWGAVTLGVLTLHRVEPGALGAAQRLDVLAAADTAALMLLGQRTDAAGARHDDAVLWADGWIDGTVSHRAEIHQATGMVVVQLGLRPDDALARLRAHAFVHQRPLIDVAHDVVGRRLVFRPDDNPAPRTEP